MTTKAKTHLTSFTGTIAATMVRGVAVMVKNVWKAWQARHDAAVLLEFDEHMLADIGLTRTDVMSAFATPHKMSERLEALARERRHASRAAARERIVEHAAHIGSIGGRA